MEKPRQIRKLEQQLIELIEKDDEPYLLAKDLVPLVGMGEEPLRMLAAQGYIPFGIGGRENSAANRIARFPKLSVYNWFVGQYEERG